MANLAARKQAEAELLAERRAQSGRRSGDRFTSVPGCTWLWGRWLTAAAVGIGSGLACVPARADDRSGPADHSALDGREAPQGARAMRESMRQIGLFSALTTALTGGAGWASTDAEHHGRDPAPQARSLAFERDPQRAGVGEQATAEPLTTYDLPQPTPSRQSLLFAPALGLFRHLEHQLGCVFRRRGDWLPAAGGVCCARLRAAALRRRAGAAARQRSRRSRLRACDRHAALTDCRRSWVVGTAGASRFVCAAGASSPAPRCTSMTASWPRSG